MIIDVRVAVVVHVADRHAHAIAPVSQSGFGCDIDKASIRFLSIQDVSRTFVRDRSAMHTGAVDEVNVQIAVEIEIEKRNPARHDRRHEVPNCPAGVMDELQFKGVGDIGKQCNIITR